MTRVMPFCVVNKALEIKRESMVITFLLPETDLDFQVIVLLSLFFIVSLHEVCNKTIKKELL